MITQEVFENIMDNQAEMALATSKENIANVRIVSFYYKKDVKTLYFATFATTDKVEEIEKNEHIAFTTIPHQGLEHVKGKALAKKSALSIFDLKDQFIAKIPYYKDIIENFGQYLEVYEITLNDVLVTLNPQEKATISLA